ncbi:hypothetical protein BDM02DRAFT_3123011 [Thelephora ganbajun]|uniref:Uncharacterized protein n=1 Tax=Thelephora ganbajun TaxID=370292 RepID=A0ACB6Z2D3_THEGA|nr:hypothetical protein BDM02DRAFT_3123011 [Thelephora ganbajun]
MQSPALLKILYKHPRAIPSSSPSVFYQVPLSKEVYSGRLGHKRPGPREPQAIIGAYRRGAWHWREKIAEAARKRKSPSDDAKPEELHHTQDLTRTDAVRNERPMHLSGPPIQIYHPVFAKFLSRAFLPFDGDEETLRQASELIKASRRCYEGEATRVQALRSHLSDLVHQDVLTQATITLDDNEWMKSDATVYTGCHWASAWPVCAFVEVKNEVGTGGCDSALQCQSDFVRLCSASAVSVVDKERFKRLTGTELYV